MKIGICCPYELGSPGGVQTQVRGLGQIFAARGHEVCVLAPGDLGEEIAGVTTRSLGRVRSISANGSVAPITLSWRASRQARAILESCDVAHLHEPFAPLLGWSSLLSASHRELSVATFHRSSSAAYDRWLSPLARFAIRRLDIAVAVSQEASRTAHALCGVEPEIVPNGVTVASALPDQARKAQLLFVGRHEERKGLEVLLEASELMTESHCLAIVGQGPQSKDLQARYPEGPSRAWLGRVSDADRDALLAKSAIYCAPSLGGESFGVVLLEAMGLGAAVVASAISGYEAAANGHARLVPPGEPFALAEALDEQLRQWRDGEGWQASREAAFAYAQTLSLEVVADRYLAIFEQGLAARRH